MDGVVVCGLADAMIGVVVLELSVRVVCSVEFVKDCGGRGEYVGDDVTADVEFVFTSGFTSVCAVSPEPLVIVPEFSLDERDNGLFGLLNATLGVTSKFVCTDNDEDDLKGLANCPWLLCVNPLDAVVGKRLICPFNSLLVFKLKLELPIRLRLVSDTGFTGELRDVKCADAEDEADSVEVDADVGVLLLPGTYKCLYFSNNADVDKGCDCCVVVVELRPTTVEVRGDIPVDKEVV